MIATVKLYLVAAVIPAIFIGLWAVFRWRFNRALGKVMYEAGGETFDDVRLTRTDTASEERLLVGGRPQRNERILHQAKHDAATLRRVFLVAGIVHLILAFGVIAIVRSSKSQDRIGAIGVAYYHLAPQLLVLLLLMRARWKAFAIAALAWFSGFVALFMVTGRPLEVGVAEAARTFVAGSDNFGIPLILVGLLALRPLSPLMTSLVPLGLLAIAPAPFLIAWIDTLEPAQREVSGIAAVAGAFSLGFGVAAAGWALRTGRTRRVAWVFLALAAVAVSAPIVPDPVSLPLTAIGGIGTNGLIIFLLAALVRGFTALKTLGWLTDDVLQPVLCWGVLAIWTTSLLLSFDAWVLLPWVAYVAALIGGLFLRSTHSTEKATPRLVLLRVFGRSRQQHRLLDSLGSTWRHIGRIDLIAGLDLALPALSGLALRDFLLSRTARWYVADTTEAARRIAALSSARAVDGRYPINEIYAGAKVWRYVVELLLVDAECVLIDLRGFTAQNRGAAYELGVATNRVPPDRLVVLVDKDSDRTAIGNVVANTWRQTSLPAPREPLRVLVCTGNEPQDSESIVSELFSALSVDSPSPSLAFAPVAPSLRT